ncbi:golgin family A protein [Trifolium repens]|nr:golgin family A protein [Trifolium repens]
MEGVGARLGRSSTRYGPATVFTGPVRKWKKKWVHVSPSSNASSNSNNTNHNHASNNNGNNGSHLLLYKWTPITQSQNNATSNGNVKDAPPEPVEEPPRRKFKYIPVAVLEEQKNEAAEIDEIAEKVEDEPNPVEADSTPAEPTSKNETLDEKPDINDVPMEESEPQDKNQVVRQDLNESLDLSLGLTSHDEDHDSDSKTNQTTDGQ